MQKRNLVLGFILSVMLISFVSAAYGSYGSFSLGELLDSIDSSTMVLGGIFLIAFTLINFSLSRVFKNKHGEPNKAIAGIIAMTISLMIIYGINKTGFDYEELFYSVGISSDLLSIIIPAMFLIAFIYMIIKKKLKYFFLIIGGIFITLTFTDLIYEKGAAAAIGIFSLIIGIWLWRRSSVGTHYNRASNYFRRGTSWGAKKAWQGSSNLYKGRGRVRNVGQAQEQAYAEKRRRESGRLQSEAREINRRVNEINTQIVGIDRAIKSAQRTRPRAGEEAAILRTEIMRLQNMKRDLEAQKRSLIR